MGVHKLLQSMLRSRWPYFPDSLHSSPIISMIAQGTCAAAPWNTSLHTTANPFPAPFVLFSATAMAMASLKIWIPTASRQLDRCYICGNREHGIHRASVTLSSRASQSLGLKLEQQSTFYSSSKTRKPLSCTAQIAMSREDELDSLEVAETDFLVVGPGVLGRSVAQLWLSGNEGSTVVGQTNTTAHHEDLKSAGIVPVVKEDPNKKEKFSYVIFCAPPSGSADYAAEVRAAAERWNGEGSLLFTSSSSLYDVNDNSVCDEESGPSVPKGKGPRTDKLLDAEDEVLKAGGNVVRLAGLYLLNRGAHTYYLSKGTVDARPDHILNLVHYEDAAALCVAILKGDGRGRIYMGCDNNPISRQDMMDAVNKSGKYDQKFTEFTGVDGPLGKRMNNNSTRSATGWKPKYESFPSFLGV